MDRRSQQDHIRAARDWLGQAEDSLARDNDVQGDLKLMLARAELAHVGQSPRSRFLSACAGKGAALLLAVVLVALFGWWEWLPSPGREQVVPVSETLQPQPAEAPPAAEPEVPEPAGAPAENVASAEERTVPEKHVPQEPARMAPQDPQPVPEKPHVPPVPPNIEKQQLMQSAGKILRQ